MNIMNIDGLGTIQYKRVEYTSTEVGSIFTSNLQTLKRILDQRPDATPPGMVTEDDYDALLATLRNLQALAKNGITDSQTSQTYYLTAEMAQSLDMVMRSLSAVGITLDTAGLSSSQKVQLLQNWQSLSGFGVENVVSNAIASVALPPSLQSMLELEYVKAGNEIISGQLANLEEAVRTTQDILKTLAVIEGISNQITVTNKQEDFKFPPDKNGDLPLESIQLYEFYAAEHLNAGNTPPPPLRPANYTGPWPPEGYVTDFTRMRNAYMADFSEAKAIASAQGITVQSAFNGLHRYSNAIKAYANSNLDRFGIFYKIAASTHFTQIIPVATPVSGAVTQLLAAKSALMGELIQLERQSSTSRDTPNSLANLIFKVITDMSSHGLIANPNPDTLLHNLKSWILDSQQIKLSAPNSNTAGSIQDNIMSAIKGAQSLNDSQKIEVKRYLFLFEQFYKSSSVILQQINDLLGKIAKGLYR